MVSQQDNRLMAVDSVQAFYGKKKISNLIFLIKIFC